MNKEYRSASILVSDGRIVSGYAVVFDSMSEDMGFREYIRKGAITNELLLNSDVVANMDHNNEYVMARYKNGTGSLKLELHDNGLYYEFEAPNTAKGDELLEHIRRGEISGASFAFTVSSEPGSDKWHDDNGVIVREIYKIDGLYDVACCLYPAYPATSCSARSLELFENAKKSLRDMKEEEDIKDNEQVKEDDNEVSEPVNEPVNENETQVDDVKEEEEEKACDPDPDKNEEEETRSDEDKLKEDVPVNDEKPEDSDNSDNSQINKQDNKNERKHNIMNKNFSLVNSIKAVVENRSFDAVSAAVIENAKNEMRSCGLAMNGLIQLPYENRSLDVATEGADVVATEIKSVLTPLRAKNIAMQLGAKWIGGLSSDIQVPVMSATNVGFASETGAAADGSNAFTSVKFSPRRLTAYVPISKQLLIQSSPDVEALIYNDLVEAINSALEEEMFSTNARTSTNPGGLLTGSPTVTNVSTFKDLTDVEAVLEAAGVLGEAKYAISPSAKSALRNLAKSAKSTQLVMENGEIDGTAALSSGHVKDTTANVIYADWTNYAICQFGNIDILVDQYTLATSGQIRLVVNCYFDMQPLRPEAFAFAKI